MNTRKNYTSPGAFLSPTLSRQEPKFLFVSIYLFRIFLTGLAFSAYLLLCPQSAYPGSSDNTGFLGDSYWGLGFGIVLGTSKNLTIPVNEVSGPIPPPGAIIDFQPTCSATSSSCSPSSFPWTVDTHIGHWYKSHPWLGWRSSLNFFMLNANIEHTSYSMVNPPGSSVTLFPNVCPTPTSCYFKTVSYTTKNLFMPSLGLDLLSLRIPLETVYPYINFGSANAILPGQSGLGAVGTGIDFSVGVKTGQALSSGVGFFVEYQLQWYVAGMQPVGTFSGTPFIIDNVVIGIDINAP